VPLAYKICRAGVTGEPAALFHVTAHGTRELPVGQWLTATDKLVRDGSGKRWYLTRFRRRERLIIVRVEIGGDVWPKPQSRSNVILSSRLKVIKIVERVKT